MFGYKGLTTQIEPDLDANYKVYGDVVGAVVVVDADMCPFLYCNDDKYGDKYNVITTAQSKDKDRYRPTSEEETRFYPIPFRDDFNGRPTFVYHEARRVAYIEWHPFYCFAGYAQGHYGRVYRYARLQVTDGKHILNPVNPGFDALVYARYGAQSMFLCEHHECILSDVLSRMEQAARQGNLPDNVSMRVNLSQNENEDKTSKTQTTLLRVIKGHRGELGMQVIADLMRQGDVPRSIIGFVCCGSDHDAPIVSIEATSDLLQFDPPHNISTMWGKRILHADERLAALCRTSSDAAQFVTQMLAIKQPNCLPDQYTNISTITLPFYTSRVTGARRGMVFGSPQKGILIHLLASDTTVP